MIQKLLSLWLNDCRELIAAVRTNKAATEERPESQPETTAVKQLKSRLRNLHCEQGIAQLAALQSKSLSFQTVLAYQFDSGEIAYTRYKAVAEQLYLNALDTLADAALVLESIRTIDPTKIEQRLAQLNNRPECAEYATLQGRAQLFRQQSERVAHWLQQNESLLTTLDRAAVKLSAIRINRRHAKLDRASAMKEMLRLAEQAERYALKPER